MDPPVRCCAPVFRLKSSPLKRWEYCQGVLSPGLPGLILCLGIRPGAGEIYSYVTKKLRVPSQGISFTSEPPLYYVAACLLVWLYLLEFDWSPGVLLTPVLMLFECQRSSNPTPGSHSYIQAGGGYLKSSLPCKILLSGSLRLHLQLFPGPVTSPDLLLLQG